MRLLDYAASAPWALLPERAPELAAIAERMHDTSPEALEAYRSHALDNGERARRRGDVAILDVSGPLFKYANLFVKISGATSYQILRRDLQAALDDSEVKSILLLVDSPGGEANGCDELAAAIYAARQVKPITAFVSGMAASGGYWIASAASRVVVSDLAMLGSIGVVLGIPDRKSADERRGIRTFEFVSSQSPGKRADPDTEDGKDRIQTMVDDLAEVFIAAVAKHRGVTADAVIKRFGAGGIKIGAGAVKAGMADEVGSLEATIASMQGSRFAPSRSPLVTAPPAPAEVTAGQEPLIGEADRYKGILLSDTGKLMPELAKALAFETTLPLAACDAILMAGRRNYERAQRKAATPQADLKAEYIRRRNGVGMDFTEFKRGAGTLGVDEFWAHHAAAGTLGAEQLVATNDVAAGWDRATAAANKRF